MTTAGAPAPGQDPGTVYLLHLNPPYRHARHYLGWTQDLAARLEAHRAGTGARLMEVVKQAGGSFSLARTWPGDRNRERAIKDRHEAPKLCPTCSPHPKPVEAGRAGQVNEPAHAAEPKELPKPQQVDPYMQGTRMAERFLQEQAAAGRSAGQISATHDYITGPWRAAEHHTPAAAETHRGYTDLIAGRLTQLRQAEAEAADRPVEHTPQHELEAGR